MSGNSRSAPVLAEDDRLRIGRFDSCELGQGVLEVRPALVAQRLDREGDIGGGHRRAVGELRFRPQFEGEGLAVVGDIDGLGQQAVEREGLIPVAAEKAFENIGTDVHRRRALDDEGVHAVEAAGDRLSQLAALRRVGICIGQVLEVRRQGRFPVHGDAMARLCLCRSEGCQRAKRADSQKCVCANRCHGPRSYASGCANCQGTRMFWNCQGSRLSSPVAKRLPTDCSGVQSV